MKRIVVLFVALVLGACASQPSPRLSAMARTEPASPQPRATVPGSHVLDAAQRSVGEQALAAIRGWYADTPADCGRASMPAFLCSGVMLRVTENNPAFYPWDPSPKSVASGGVSFSWIRQDTNFSRLAYGYGNGYIFDPSERAPTGKDRYQVLCFFPMDADTNTRPSQEGCGPHPRAPGTSGPCDTLGITTGVQWVAHFDAIAIDKHHGQCGWNVRHGAASDTADRFMQGIDGRRRMPAASWAIQDEIRAATWPRGRGATLPIRAFFYVTAKAGALANAQDDQTRYRDAYGIDIPVIRLTLPASSAGKASFDYFAGDQTGTGGEPGPVTQIDFETLTPGRYPSVAIGSDLKLTAAVLSVERLATPLPQVSGIYVRAETQGSPGDRNELLVMTPRADVTRLSFGYSLNPGFDPSATYVFCQFSNDTHLMLHFSGVDGDMACRAPEGATVSYVIAQAINTSGRDPLLRVDNVHLE
ncbi:hypothetical protein [Luteibacter sp. ME-Dv--P-043b]|jgi:hypothetical protein|uniref:hypothetical protein n=1 Tax=Luteibacter sp. ME-Dv--P-043b TaxID=3040291 RepID=UPI0025548DA9|nr:hypothetical protein [Luteibacter sp. ME-Dv--P-043b]